MGLQEKLKELRLNNNISQKRLADAIGVAQSSINYWEKGQRTPSVSAAQKLADFFDITLDELYDIDNADNLPKATATFAAHLGGDEFTEEEWKQIRQFAEFVKSKRDQSHLEVNAAHARTDVEVTDEMKKYDDDLLDD